MKITKILVALSFLFAVSTANAGELTVTGSMEATYHSQSDTQTGNPLGMDRELKFAGTTELDNGMTVSVMQDTSDNLGYGNSQVSFGNVMGLATIYVGSDSDPVDAIDDITPSAYEEAWGSGSGTLNDIGDLAGEMGIGAKFDLPILGAVNAKYYPKVDGTKNADNASSGGVNHGVGSGESITLKTDLGAIPFTNGIFDGATLTTGYSANQNNMAANTSDAMDLTAAINYSIGSFKLGIQKKYHNEGEASEGAEVISYRDMAIGVVYAINDELSISYNRYDSMRQQASVVGKEQSTDAINIGYTVGGMTIGFQEASTDNAGWVSDAKDDTRTLGVSVAF
jgi:hypothetical protein